MASSNSRQGELIFSHKMREAGYTIQDVSGDPHYWDKDIDFLATSPRTGATRSFEVKWDSRLASTGNLYLELTNIHSKGGAGWFRFCQADFVAYGDASTKTFYIFDMEELRARVTLLPDRQTNCGTDSIGLLVRLRDVLDIAKTI